MSLFAVILAAAMASGPVPSDGSVAITTVDANQWVGVDVNVEAWNRPEVTVDQQTLKGNGDDVRPQIARDGNAVRVTAVYNGPRNSSFFGLFHWGTGTSVRWTVHVPSSRPLDVHVANGRISVAGVAAALTLHASNGNLTVTGAGPMLDASTSNGEIEATMATLSGGPPQVQLHTSNGNIRLHVPRGFSARFDTHTSNGVVTNPLHDGSGPGNANIRTSNGDIDISVNS